MALKTTPTIAICLAAGLAAGVALARPGDPDSISTDSRYESSADVAADAGPGPYGGDSGDQPSEPAAQLAFTIEGFDFAGPADVPAGAIVEVTNLDGANHPLTSDDGLFDTGGLGQNDAATFVAPDAPGTYTFFCVIHPAMQGAFDVS